MPAQAGILAAGRCARSEAADVVRAKVAGAEVLAPVEGLGGGDGEVEPVLRDAFAALAHARGKAGGGHLVQALARIGRVAEQAERHRVGLVARSEERRVGKECRYRWPR